MLNTYNKTRFETKDGQKLFYRHYQFLGGKRDWRIVHYDPAMPQNLRFSPVGPPYKTKAELLADLDRYGKEFGF